jgi:hypothetical protein
MAKHRPTLCDAISCKSSQPKGRSAKLLPLRFPFPPVLVCAKRHRSIFYELGFGRLAQSFRGLSYRRDSLILLPSANALGLHILHGLCRTSARNQGFLAQVHRKLLSKEVLTQRLACLCSSLCRSLCHIQQMAILCIDQFQHLLERKASQAASPALFFRHLRFRALKALYNELRIDLLPESLYRSLGARNA